MLSFILSTKPVVLIHIPLVLCKPVISDCTENVRKMPYAKKCNSLDCSTELSSVVCRINNSKGSLDKTSATTNRGFVYLMCLIKKFSNRFDLRCSINYHQVFNQRSDVFYESPLIPRADNGGLYEL